MLYYPHIQDDVTGLPLSGLTLWVAVPIILMDLLWSTHKFLALFMTHSICFFKKYSFNYESLILTKMEKLYTVNKNKTRSWLWLRSWTPYSKFRLKLKKVGKTTSPFRYDLNQIPYDYTVEVRNSFKGLDLIDCLMNYGWRFVTLYRKQWSTPSPRNRNAKWLSEEALQIAVKRREVKVKEKKRERPIWMKSSKE